MKRIRMIRWGWSICLLALVALSCERDDCIRAEGPITERLIQLQPFNRLELDINAELIIDQDTTLENPTIRIDAQQNIRNLIAVTPFASHVRISFDKCVKRHGEVKIYVRTKDLNALVLNGPGTIRTESIFRTEFLSLALNGQGDVDLVLEAERVRTRIVSSGNARLAGFVRAHQIKMFGSGEVNSFGMITDTTDVDIFGTGISRITTTTFLDVLNEGTGNVEYRGTPEIEETGQGGAFIIDSNL